MPVSSDTILGKNVIIFNTDLVNIYGAKIGDECRIGAFVEIQRGVIIGSRCKIQSHTFICDGVEVDDEVFVGHGVMFTNDLFPRSTRPDGLMKGPSDWICKQTKVGRKASIGTGVTVLPGIMIGDESLIGAGAVVTLDVPKYAIVVGNPARIVGDIRNRK